MSRLSGLYRGISAVTSSSAPALAQVVSDALNALAGEPLVELVPLEPGGRDAPAKRKGAPDLAPAVRIEPGVDVGHDAPREKNRGGGETMEAPPPQGNPAEEERGTCSPPRRGGATGGVGPADGAWVASSLRRLAGACYAGPVRPCTPSLTATVVLFAAAGLIATPTSGFEPVPAVLVQAVPFQ